MVNMKLKALAATAGLALILAIGAMYGPGANAAHVTSVGLGTAQSFAVLAGSGITNTGSTVINGDIGSFPTTTISGFPPGIVNGTDHGGDAVTQGAKTDLVTAYNDAAGRTPATTIPTELGGSTLTHGVYASAAGTFGITGALTLDAQGDANAVWIFKMATTLTTATASSVVLIGGAQSCNVFWQVGSSATLGGSTSFVGNILAQTSITMVTSATVDGRVLARDGAVTLDTNTITRSTCAAAATPTPIATATPTPIGTVTPTPIGTATATPIATTTATPIATTTAPLAAAATPTPTDGATAAPSVPPTPARTASPGQPATSTPGLTSSLPSTSTGDTDNVPGWAFLVSVIALTLFALMGRARAREAKVKAGS